MREATIEMTDGFLTHAVVTKPEGKPVGHIHLLHGMAEHIGRYEEFAEYLVAKGYIVSGHDHRGHGKTAKMNGIKGHFADENGFDHVVQDAYEIISKLREQYPSPRFILFGHSMGSFVARRYVQLHGSEVDLAIFSGTGGDPGASRFAGQAAAYIRGKKNGFDQPDNFLNKLVFGGFNKSVQQPKTPFDWLSRDTEAVEKYIVDPACGTVPTTQFFADLFKGLGVIHDNDEVKKVPEKLSILLISGNEDPVGNNGKGVWEVAKQYDNAGLKNVTVMLFEGGRHEMLHEKNRHHVFKAVYDWIGKID
ncbi:lysophospholipase [Sporosarcina sp. ANT_H38]|uniref:alpha/beta hydrolase n=1 Tax=Sporosarcina sp. ANT_H38 TaxID=2597358 RepID=UPI0011F0CB7D|nr:alpha/beta hydrolase [Sporosarcina sp. ANT_H38]KAA0966442.1 lysophospholipase [Sporosarcina sp. ANT_H38]